MIMTTLKCRAWMLQTHGMRLQLQQTQTPTREEVYLQQLLRSLLCLKEQAKYGKRWI